MKLIQGVTVKPLRLIPDERGYLMDTFIRKRQGE